MSAPFAEYLKADREAELEAAAALELTREVTVRDFLNARMPNNPGEPIGVWFIWARGKMSRVSHIRWPESDPWAICPEENGGFGLSYCVHYGTRLWTK